MSPQNEANDTLVCTCDAWDQPYMHEIHCALWEDEDFFEGIAMWSSAGATLLPAPIDRAPEGRFDQVLEEIDQIIDVESEEIPVKKEKDAAGLIETTKAAIKAADLGEEDEYITELLTGALDILPDDVTDIEIEEFIDSIDQLLIEPEKIGALFIYQLSDMQKTAIAYMGCICEDKNKPTHFYCATCRVVRPTSTDPWEFGSWDRYQYKQDPESWNPWTGAHTGKGSTTKWTPKCRHYGQEVEFPDGTKIWASSQHKRKEDEAIPNFGIYLASSWSPNWLAFQVNWQDFDLPNIPYAEVVHAAKEGLKLAKSGSIVEIGCVGGHGRTGTMLAAMAVLSGVDGKDAVKWVRDNYCKEAIEGERQEWFPLWVEAHIKGLPSPKKPERKSWSSTTSHSPGPATTKPTTKASSADSKQPPVTHSSSPWLSQNKKGTTKAPSTSLSTTGALILAATRAVLGHGWFQ